MTDKVMINSIDVTDYRTKWKFDSEWDTSIDSCNLELTNTVRDLFTITPGQEVIITRGTVTSTDEAVFSGQITQVKPQTSIIKLVCKGKMYDAVKSAQTKSWDKNIDIEEGVGSEIFKTICDNSTLSYSAASIPTTGTDNIYKIVKFIQRDEDDFQKMNELAKIYDRIISYDYDNDLVEFKDKGYDTYAVSLTVGTEIPGQIKWKENMEQMINQVRVLGATVYDKIPETFAGPGTEFTLQRTPEDTEVYINHAGADTIQTRGQKDLGTIGTDFDYYIDEDQKKLVFSVAVSDVYINYGSQVPLPVTVSDQPSIDTYGGPNKKPHFKKFTFTDIKDFSDAQKRARAILAKYSTPFIEAVNIPVTDATIETNGNFKPGTVVEIIDGFNDKTHTVFVAGIKKTWPHVYDMITVGDEIWRTENWQSRQAEKIESILADLNKNQDLLTEVIDLTRTVSTRRRYMTMSVKDRSSDGVNTFILGHSEFAVLGTQELGDAGTAFAVTRIVQGNNTYQELCYDTTFKDAANTTADWDTTNKWIDFTSGEIFQTSQIELGTAWANYTVSVADQTGTLTFTISGDNGTSWEAVTLDTLTAFSTTDGTGILLKITESGATTARLENTYNADGSYDEPAIKVILQ